MTSPTVFISYSHKDEAWKDRLVTHLGVLQQAGLLDLWDDRRIGAGGNWYQKIEDAIARASVAVLLVSADFLTSKFIHSKEIPDLLERRDKEGLRIYPVIIRPCAWKHVKWLARMNLRPKDGRPIQGGSDFQVETDLAAIADEIAGIIGPIAEMPESEGYVPLGPEKISLAKLPSTNPELFGRDKELKMLDEVWDNTSTNIITLVAWGGVGKTALVNTWLSKMRQDNFRGAERVFGWSFYSQGAAEAKQASADQFIASALKWFGDLEPDAGSPWEKGERLAEFVRNQKTLLILDGLEPLQHPFSGEVGRIRDPGLQSLVRELANHNPGLCVITTRLNVDDLKDFTGTTAEKIPLEHLSDEAGMELLKYLGVKGADDELKQAVREFDGHALALMLLGTYLSIVYKGDVEKRDRIAKLTKEKKYGGRVRQMMESYEIWFKDQPELDILRMMGLFDRPAEGGAIEVLRAAPPIKGLTTKLTDLSHEDWQFALNNLRKAGLLAKEDPAMPDTLDCHPLIREHFGDELKQNNPEVWHEAHSRLYEYYKNQAKEYPDTIEEMSPLYAAVAHGCQAGRYQEAMEDVFLRRIRRRGEAFNIKKLGAFGADLVAISGFFDSLWDKPVAGLTEADKAFILNEAGFDLRALGRLKEAAQPMKAALEMYIAQEDWRKAAIVAGNLSELYLTIGDIALALEYANQSIDLADRSGDAFQRMDKRTAMADALHQAGRQSEAEYLFRKAEEMQKDRQPKPTMYSLPGFRYCDLLLSQGKYQEVLSRASETIKIAKTLSGSLSLWDIALDYLSLGRGHLLHALQEDSLDFTQAAEHLNQAVDGLRQSGSQDHLPRGLLARAELYRVKGEFERVQHDIKEAMTIAERGEMGLHQADCHLEYARLYLAMRDKDRAREHLAIARKMVEQMGYHRRDHEVKELEAML
ncbi:MAG: TIR domain-containing protein [Halobacteriota archaeon]